MFNAKPTGPPSYQGPAEPATEVLRDPETPSNADHFYERGKALLKQNQPSLAVVEFQNCLKKNPRHAGSYKMLGRAYIMIGRESDAIDAFEKYVALAPSAKDAPKVQAIIDRFRSPRSDRPDQ